MNISLLCAGKLKEKYLRDAAAEYVKRLSRYCRLNIAEVEDGPDIRHETDRLLKRLNENSYIICLEIDGESLSSEEFADRLNSLALEGKSSVTFIIGGSDGLSEEITKRADMHLSFSRLTFTHQMMRVILLEQIYRCFKIINKEPYHK